nr:MAG TPA: hypothetical protein [Caudoviricetes sp.]
MLIASVIWFHDVVEDTVHEVKFAEDVKDLAGKL